VLKNTRRDVIAKSNGQQRPDQAGILSSDFYFFSAAEPAQKDTERTVPEEPIIKPSDSRNPGGVDSDLDGTPDATDPCPNDYGTLAANGCPDYDEDGVPNSVDKCPNLAGKKAWQGCPDSDEDGVPDHEDKCPFEPGTLADKGCLSPNEDRDGDGVLNSTDKCPSIKGSPENGCPSPPFVKKHVVLQGETLLSLAKKYNLIVAEITQVNKFDNDEQLSSGKTILIPISAIGVDSDSDGIPDREDNCTRLKGPALYKGCPNLEPYGYGPDDLVMVTEGNFLMGRIDFGNEQPIHNVSVPTFELGKYEVTNAQYCVFLNDINIKDTINISSESGKVIYKGNVIFRSNNEGDNHLTREIIFGEYSGDLQVGTLFSPKSGYENHPAVLVSWHGANAYCNWLSQKTGQHYRLPSEAEWEFAAKGGNASKGFKYAGGNSLDDVAWYSANSDDKRHPVGQKKNNELGLYDMNGNVWEWCADSWHDSYLNAPNDGSAWFSNQNLYLMVSRGGSYFNRERDLPRRAPESSPEKTAKGLGFRIARDIERK
jgi:formylglycine-generating enzyme required for sulfatase activity